MPPLEGPSVYRSHDSLGRVLWSCAAVVERFNARVDFPRSGGQLGLLKLVVEYPDIRLPV